MMIKVWVDVGVFGQWRVQELAVVVATVANTQLNWILTN